MKRLFILVLLISVPSATFALDIDVDSNNATDLAYGGTNATTAAAARAALGVPAVTNVLELDNTDAFTPDADHEPATKKYVDDGFSSIAFNMRGSLSNLLYDTGSNFLLDTDTSVNHVWSASKIGTELALKADLTGADFTGVVTANVNVITGGTATLTATQARGSLYITNATSTITLPDAVSGYSVCVVSGQGQTGALTIAIDASDYIVTDGVRGTLGASKASTGAAGDKICLVSDSTDWYVTSSVGF